MNDSRTQDAACTTCGMPVGDTLTDSTHDHCLEAQDDWQTCPSCHEPAHPVHAGACVVALKIDRDRLRQEREKLEAEVWRLRQERDDARNEVKHAKLAGEIEEREHIIAFAEGYGKTGFDYELGHRAFAYFIQCLKRGDHGE